MNYYNEHDPKAAEWLRQLISASLIPFGHVDTRSITDVTPADLRSFEQCHFFAGIGGWPLALALARVCPSRRIWTASCPCQPFSTAGKGKGTEDDRHLWPVFAKLVEACQPSIVFGEQVASKAGREWFAGIRDDLERMGYEVGGADLCAASIGAPHIRQRIYWCAASRLGEPDRPGRDQGEPTGTTARHRGAAEPTGDAGRLADAASVRRAKQWNEQGQEPWRGAPQDDAPERARPCGMDHAQRGGRSAGGSEDGRDDRQQPDPANGNGGRLADAEHNGRGADIPKREPEGGTADGGTGEGAGRLAITPGEGLQEREEPGTADPQLPTAIRAGAWDGAALLRCADGKARRVEPGIFPLAHGVSGRVGLLRGYGNAIVPPLAAVFIEEALQVIDAE